MKRFAVTIATVASLAGVDAASAREDALFGRLKELSGPIAIACGTVTLKEDAASAFQCARDSLASGRPFWVAVQMQGTDSFLWRGVALEADKTVWLLSYDSDVHGGGGYGRESLQQGICRNVQFSMERRIFCP